MNVSYVRVYKCFMLECFLEIVLINLKITDLSTIHIYKRMLNNLFLYTNVTFNT
jgi:hypothetical protein